MSCARLCGCTAAAQPAQAPRSLGVWECAARGVCFVPSLPCVPMRLLQLLEGRQGIGKEGGCGASELRARSSIPESDHWRVAVTVTDHPFLFCADNGRHHRRHETPCIIPSVPEATLPEFGGQTGNFPIFREHGTRRDLRSGGVYGHETAKVTTKNAPRLLGKLVHLRLAKKRQIYHTPGLTLGACPCLISRTRPIHRRKARSTRVCNQ